MPPYDVILINMPFGPLVTPSLALSIIKPLLNDAGIRAKVSYANVDFAEQLNFSTYHYIACGLPRAHDLVGEFIFARSLFRESAAPPSKYLAYLETAFNDLRRQQHFTTSEKLLQILSLKLAEFCDLADSFIDQLANQIIAETPRVVGFTSAFQQNTPSLALAKVIKDRAPEIKLIMGGANCEGKMGARIFEEFEFLDCVITGEAEPIVVDAVRYLIGEAPCPFSSSSLFRSPATPVGTHQALTLNLDRVPLPDFSEFFESVKDHELPEYPRLLFETSRGCWWGEKHHCKFCGLNGSTMLFRKKDPDTALKQIVELHHQYPNYAICMTDNIIDSGYLRTFVPRLVEENLSVDLFYEMKANLKKEHVELIAKAGITRIQPGIESLSDDILRIMDKGITALQNLQLLKWCREFSVEAAWNFLWGFPGEPSNEYERMAKLIPNLTHLNPPAGVGRLRLDRFSPYFENASASFANVRPFEAYNLVYAMPSEAIRDIAYFFDGDLLSGEDPTEYTRLAMEALVEWKASAEHSFLFFKDLGRLLLIFDTRATLDQSYEVSFLQGVDREIILAGDHVTGIAAIEKSLKERFCDIDLRVRMLALAERGYIAIDSGKFLTLVVNGNEQYPGPGFWNRISSATIDDFEVAPHGTQGRKSSQEVVGHGSH